MQEILFRGKRIDNGEWICGFYYIKPNPCSEDGEPKYYAISDLPPFGAEIHPETVGQYTGLTDKNGKKIFEGDICRIKEHGDVDLAVISFEHGAFYATPHNANIHEHTLWDIWYNDFDIEIIGNIHDNLELLEEQS